MNDRRKVGKKEGRGVGRGEREERRKGRGVGKGEREERNEAREEEYEKKEIGKVRE